MKHSWLLYLIAALLFLLAGAFGTATHQRSIPILWYFLFVVFLVVAVRRKKQGL
ncbi:MAG: hypothetical protein ACYC46_11405 [Acidobacteriaceae bacterium]